MAKQIRCPKCGSEEIKFNLRSAGTESRSNYYRTGIKKSWFIPAGMKSRKSNRKHKVICVCQNCGHCWEKTGILDTVFGIAVVIIVLSVVISLISPKEKADSRSPETSQPEIEKTWASECTPLDEFDYYIDDGGIHIKKCNSRSKSIFVSAFYSYEGRDLPVVSIEGGMVFRPAESIIISEGVEKIEHSAFNGCGVKYLYLPSTLSEFSGFFYFRNGKKLYYGGSKEQFGKLYIGDRESIDFVEIIFDSSVDSLKD